jgi:hypothetical protein
MRRIIVGFSGGVTSAWCAGWALATFPREEIVLLFHDTKEEHEDTYRFLREMSAALDMPITERSDGRSVTQVFRDEGFLGNNQNAMCSRILKQEPGTRYLAELRSSGVDEIVRVWGFSAKEPRRVQNAVGKAVNGGFSVRFPCIETGTTKQQAADWVQCTMKVKPPSVYEWAQHANCRGCVKGGMAYWLATLENDPEIYWQRSGLEEEFGNGILRGGDREHHLLKDLVRVKLKREVKFKESIEIGACECGD